MRSLYYMKQHWLRWLSSHSRQGVLCTAVVCTVLLCLLPLSLTRARIFQEQAAQELAPQVLRFHVLANSNSPADQQLKLEVRDILLHAIYDHFSPDSSTEVPEYTEPTKAELLTYIKENSDSLEAAAATYLKTKGISYSAEILIEPWYFPTRQYGDITFPSGTYDAVRVVLGNGAGRNWWCVLYPSLCLSAVTLSGEIPDASKAALQAMVPEEDYAWMSAKRNFVFGEETLCPNDTEAEESHRTNSAAVTIRIRFRLADWLSSVRSDSACSN